MTGDELRALYLSFFEERGHLRMSSASLIPVGDPTLLLTSAGMVPFKPYFTGEATPPNPRLTSCQKCFRTSDIDGVGDTKHLTFFEMLGNFSIGDYFKEEAITWAWEFVTQRLDIPADRLWVTVYTDDDEAFHIWRDQVGVPEERIYRYGRSDNWWGPAGSEGPCGPCSEIHYDFGAHLGCSPMAAPDEAAEYVDWDVGCHPNCTRCERFSELWNLVFMQFYQHQDGSQAPLPKPNIDTGMGLERTAAVLQGKENVYETDFFAPIIAKVAELAGKRYGADRDTDEAMRVVAEHSRAITFLIADGVVPGNEGRSYVLRRVIRRAIRFGRRLGLQQVFLGEMAQTAIEHMSSAYPELVRNRAFILKTIELEESLFQQTLTTGMPLLEEGIIAARKGLLAITDELERYLLTVLSPAWQIRGGERRPLNFGGRAVVLRNKGIFEASDLEETVAPEINRLAGVTLERVRHRDLVVGFQRFRDSLKTFPITEVKDAKAQLESLFQELRKGASQITAIEAFVLHDTYGLPPEVTQEIAAEHGLTVDMEGFEREMEAQRERARGVHRFDVDVERTRGYEGLGVNATAFVGYETLIQPTVVVGLLLDGEPVNRVSEGQTVEVVLRETPFYPEGGGQAGDGGEIAGERGVIQVEDTQRPVGDLIVHSGRVREVVMELGELVEARVDRERRLSAARNHTATHLLHAALREVLGTHVRQAGSLVAPDRLRLDFTSVAPMSREEMERVERLVNGKIREDLQVRKRETAYQTALQEGALAFFGERYADQVRVVEVDNPDMSGPFSLEVCGGTHLERTGEVGAFLIVSESSIGSGMRRIEALTGHGAEAFIRDRLHTLAGMADLLQTTPGDLEERARALVEELEQTRRRAQRLERQVAQRSVEELLGQVQEVAGARVVVGRAEALSVEAMRETGDWLKERLGSGIVVLGAVLEGRPTLVAMVTPDLVSKGFHAGSIVSEAAKVVGGGGGGRPHLAQAGGRQPEKLDEALAAVPRIVASLTPSQE